MTEAERIAGELTEAQRRGLLAFPDLREADPVRRIAAVTYAGLWRKLSKHWDAMLVLEVRGLVERNLSRGEILWRPTRPLGLQVRAILNKEQSNGE